MGPPYSGTMSHLEEIMKTGKETPRKMASGQGTKGFIELCEKYNITPTHRQYRKWLNRKGRLHNAMHKSEA